MSVHEKGDVMADANGRGSHGQRRWRRLVGLLLVGAAVLSELAKPRGQRTWEGKLAGLVPYDLRRPTIKRFRERWWNRGDRRIVVPTPLGVGWTVNVAGLLKRVRK